MDNDKVKEDLRLRLSSLDTEKKNLKMDISRAKKKYDKTLKMKWAKKTIESIEKIKKVDHKIKTINSILEDWNPEKINNIVDQYEQSKKENL